MPATAAAAALGVSLPTLKRWIRDGCPVARRGRRGRGGAALVDPDAVQAWRRAARGEDALVELAGRLPEIVGAAMAQAFRLAPDKRGSTAWVAVAGWQLATGAVLDHLRAQGVEITDPPIPESIEQLRQIAAKRSI